MSDVPGQPQPAPIEPQMPVEPEIMPAETPAEAPATSPVPDDGRPYDGVPTPS